MKSLLSPTVLIICCIFVLCVHSITPHKRELEAQDEAEKILSPPNDDLAFGPNLNLVKGDIIRMRPFPTKKVKRYLVAKCGDHQTKEYQINNSTSTSRGRHSNYLSEIRGQRSCRQCGWTTSHRLSRDAEGPKEGRYMDAVAAPGEAAVVNAMPSTPDQLWRIAYCTPENYLKKQ